MRFSLSRLSEPLILFIGGVSVVVLWVSACSLVWTQYRVRLLFAEIERAGDMSRRLSDDSSQLSLDLSRAALPRGRECPGAAVGVRPGGTFGHGVGRSRA